MNLVRNLGHESVFEHVNFTFAIDGVSRSLTHQLVRHRLASYSQQSQRYVKLENFKFVTPPLIKKDEKALKIYEKTMKEQRKLNEVGTKAVQVFLAFEKVTRKLPAEPTSPLPDSYTGGQTNRIHPLDHQFFAIHESMRSQLGRFRKSLLEIGRRIQHMDGGIRHYKEDIGEMIKSLKSSKGQDTIMHILDDRMKNLEGTVQKELVDDINGLVELLQGVANNIIIIDEQIKKAWRLEKALRG